MTENKKFVDIYMPYIWHTQTQFSSLKLKYGQIYVTECLKPKSKELHFKIVNKGRRFVFVFLKMFITQGASGYIYRKFTDNIRFY